MNLLDEYIPVVEGSELNDDPLMPISKYSVELIDELGGLGAYTDFRNEHDNSKLNDMLLNRNVLEKVVEKNQHLIRKYEPVYMEPSSRLGRAHLYAPVKKIGGIKIDTLWFNLIFIWFTSLVLYLTLYYDVLRKVITYFDNVRLRRLN